MPVYAYRGVTAAGKPARGSVTAETIRAARARMKADGVFLTDISEANTTGSRTGEDQESAPSRFQALSIRRIPTMQRAIATRQLATLVGAGIPLVDSLTALVQQIEAEAQQMSGSGAVDVEADGVALDEVFERKVVGARRCHPQDWDPNSAFVAQTTHWRMARTRIGGFRLASPT